MYLFTHTTKASTCHSTYVEVREHLWVSVLPFHHVGLRDGTHLSSLGSKSLLTEPSCLTLFLFLSLVFFLRPWTVCNSQ